jgi:hypothetical protein
MATVNQIMPRSGQPNRFSFHMEISDRTTQVRPRNTISHRLKAIIVSSGCTRPICSWTASVSLLSGHLAATYRFLELAGLPYQLALEAAL